MLAEYLYDRVIEAPRKDLREEIQLIGVFEKAHCAVMDLVDMPDREIWALERAITAAGRSGD